jgi:hypothetical protein
LPSGFTPYNKLFKLQALNIEQVVTMQDKKDEKPSESMKQKVEKRYLDETLRNTLVYYMANRRAF